MKNSIGYIDTSDKIDHDTAQVYRIFALMDTIEHKIGKMLHEIPELNQDLELWQDKKLKNSYFFNKLAKYWDSINK